MKNRHTSLGAVVCLAVLLASTGWAQQEARYQELPNFHKVSDQLYRGAQPQAGGVKKLAELGVKTIINLRGEDEISRDEQKEAEAAGLRYFSISMPGLSAPSDEQVARAMSIIDNSENQPVFIHCKRGSDRTGTIVAVYRISHHNWTGDRAMAEAKAHGMSWTEFGMKSYIANYYKQARVRQNQPDSATATSK